MAAERELSAREALGVAGPRSFYRAGDGRVRRDVHPREIAEIVRTGAGQLWVDIDSNRAHPHALLERVFNFHPLAIEDTLHPNSRVIAFEERTRDPYDPDTANLYFFLGRNFLVGVHAGPSRPVADIVDQFERSAELLGRGVERLMHAIMDAAIDAYFPILDQVDEFTHQVEERVFASFDPRALHDIFSVKRLVLALRRHLSPQRDVFNVLTNRPSALITPESQVYFRDIYDHVLRINESLETFRDLLSSTLDAYLTQISNRLGMATKGLTVVATLSVPFVVISGMWGMNFEHVPPSHAPHGFWLMLALQLAIGVLLLVVLRWRRWL
jgi:magnesium transporter